MTADLPINDFRDWLKSLPQDERFAKPCHAFSCPIARWSTKRLVDSGLKGYSSACTRYLEYRYDGNVKTYRLPDWATRFINKLDNTFQWQSTPLITPADALSVLNVLEEETGG